MVVGSSDLFRWLTDQRSGVPQRRQGPRSASITLSARAKTEWRGVAKPKVKHAELRELPPSTSAGLIGLRERLALVGSTLEVAGQRGRRLVVVLSRSALQSWEDEFVAMSDYCRYWNLSLT